MDEQWEECSDEDLPDSFHDPNLANFRTCCSNGFVGSISIGSAFSHNPRNWPQCFPNGPDSNAICRSFIERKVTSPNCKPTEK